MRKSKKQDENLSKKTWKRKFYASLSMLLVSAILMILSTYAWLVLSTAPEVSGITTNIGANGSLEITLLNTENRNDLSAIKTSDAGNTISTVGAYTANTTWGNLIDLSDERYGMSNIALLPARLKLSGNDGNYQTEGAYLSIPKYDYDGRVVQISEGTVSAIYGSSNGTSDFYFKSNKQDYGVRAIGTAVNVDSLSSALSSARGNVMTSATTANNTAKTAFENNGEGVFSIMITHMGGSSATHSDKDVTSLKALAMGLQESLGYIENAYRQAIVGYAAANAENYEAFSPIKDKITDKANALSSLVSLYAGTIPVEFITSVKTLENLQNDIRAAINDCNALSGGSYTWAQISPIMKRIMDTDKVFIDSKKLSDTNPGDILGASGEVVVTLGPGSGVPAGIADFAGNYDASYKIMGKDIKITTQTKQSPTYLKAVSDGMDSLKANDSGSASVDVTSPLKAIYGYAIDLAFRTNATGAQLQLQTDSAQRVYQDSTSNATQGGGSYMEFSSSSDIYGVGDLVNIMDAVRVGFVDDMNNVLGIARLNTSNYSSENGKVKAPLYLYKYTVENGVLKIDERRKTDSAITSLDRNIVKAVTAVVWLDGDMIDNTMVAADKEAALSGVLNLQFSTDIDLIPVHNDSVYSLTVDREGLKTQVEKSAPIINNGKGMNTTESWNKFTVAYNYADAVNKDETSTPIQVANATKALEKAESDLKEVTHDALKGKIKEVRDEVGTTDKVARLAYYYDGTADLPEGIDKNTPAGVITKNPDDIKTEDEYKKYTPVYTVDYEKNLREEFDGSKTLIYTEESWLALADALYHAEIKDLDPTLTNDELDDAITVLDNAFKSLVFENYYEAYELNGEVYYFSQKDYKDDTYGQWYDSNFKRVVADKLILDLDTRAEPLEVATIEIQDYIDNTNDKLLPGVKLGERYKTGDEIIGLHWECDDLKLFSFEEKLAELDNLIAQAKQKGYTGAALDEAVNARNTFNGEDSLDSYITSLKTALSNNNPTEGFMVPIGPDSYTFINRIEMPNTLLHIKGENVNTTVRLSAWVLTKNGVIYKVTKDVTLYTKASDAELESSYETELIAGNEMTSAGVSLISDTTTETIRSYSWASSNTNVAVIKNPTSAECKIVGVEAGTTEISVSVETYQGNTYTSHYTIIVNPAPEPDPEPEQSEEPTETP